MPRASPAFTAAVVTAVVTAPTFAKTEYNTFTSLGRSTRHVKGALERMQNVRGTTDIKRDKDRLGEESARETSIVRYTPGARFDADAHRGGEEFLVLAGSLRAVIEGVIRDGARFGPRDDAGLRIMTIQRAKKPQVRACPCAVAALGHWNCGSSASPALQRCDAREGAVLGRRLRARQNGKRTLCFALFEN